MASIPLFDNFQLQRNLPLDTRSTVADTAAREAIPAGARYVGLETFQADTGVYYSLVGGIENSNWVERTGGGETTDLSTTSVTALQDVSSAGSGAIITDTERTALHPAATITQAGSGNAVSSITIDQATQVVTVNTTTITGGGTGDDPDARHLSAVDTGSISIPFSTATTVTLTLGEIILTGFDSSFDTSTVTRGARLFLEETDTDNAGFLYEGRVQAITNTSLIIVPEQAQFATTRMFVVAAGGTLPLSVPNTTSASGFLGADNLIVGSETFLNTVRVDGGIELGGNVVIDNIATTTTATTTALVRNRTGRIVEAGIDFPAATEIDFLNQTDNKRLWEGTLAEYNAITTYDGNTYYNITDDGGVHVDDGSNNDDVPSLASNNRFTAENFFGGDVTIGPLTTVPALGDISRSISFNENGTFPRIFGTTGGTTNSAILSLSATGAAAIELSETVGAHLLAGNFVAPPTGGVQFGGILTPSAAVYTLGPTALLRAATPVSIGDTTITTDVARQANDGDIIVIGDQAAADLLTGTAQTLTSNIYLVANRSGNTLTLDRAIEQTGDVYVVAGSVLSSAAGSNVVAKTLDDYEEGTWTPGFNGFSTTITTATYTKIGDQVTVYLDTGAITPSSGLSRINGLPFAVLGTSPAQIEVFGADGIFYGVAIASVVSPVNRSTGASAQADDFTADITRLFMTVTYKTT